jgi:NTP pyrophosphatase (non-canonical NTP hydrolase)
MVTIRDFQNVMNNLYFERDKKRGVEATLNWLRDEIDELSEALNKKEKDLIEEEFADVLAWLASLANISNIDLQIAAMKKYNYKCPKCQSSPCDCPYR